MAKTKFQGKTLRSNLNLPKVGDKAPNFKLIKSDLSETSLKDFKGKKIILNIFPSIDTGTCATSVKTFNKKLEKRKKTVVLCISMDLPFAQSRFCEAKKTTKVITLSGFRSDFGKVYGIELTDSVLKGLYARGVVVINDKGKVVHQELVSEITEEPNYDAALAALT